MNRKTLLKEAFEKTGDLPVKPEAERTTPEISSAELSDLERDALPSERRVPSGAIRAMGLSLGRLTEEAARAEALAQQLASGDRIVELDPKNVVPSFVDDRIHRTEDPEFRRLVDSIAQSNQQVPILVRPHPTSANKYQVAYGHRRLNACQELGRTVNALVRPLTDAELVVAQGKENAEHRALSFIERAMFASHLDQQGFDRATVQASLAVHPAELSRLLTVARSIPKEFVSAIGAAPRAGRPRWMEFAALLERPGCVAALRSFIAQPSFSRVGSDRRFALVMERLRQTTENTAPDLCIRDANGRPVIRGERTQAGLRLLIDFKIAPGLDQYVLEQLPAIVAAFECQ